MLFKLQLYPGDVRYIIFFITFTRQFYCKVLELSQLVNKTRYIFSKGCKTYSLDDLLVPKIPCVYKSTVMMPFCDALDRLCDFDGGADKKARIIHVLTKESVKLQKKIIKCNVLNQNKAPHLVLDPNGTSIKEMLHMLTIEAVKQYHVVHRFLNIRPRNDILPEVLEGKSDFQTLLEKFSELPLQPTIVVKTEDLSLMTVAPVEPIPQTSVSSTVDRDNLPDAPSPCLSSTSSLSFSNLYNNSPLVISPPEPLPDTIPSLHSVVTPGIDIPSVGKGETILNLRIKWDTKEIIIGTNDGFKVLKASDLP